MRTPNHQKYNQKGSCNGKLSRVPPILNPHARGKPILSLGNLKRKKPYLVAKGIRPKRNSEKNTRTLGELDIMEEQNPVSGGQEVTVTLTGEGFLYHMVRVIVGALVEVGHGRISPAKFAQAVADANRDAFPEAAPAHGLYLERVWYPESREAMLSRCSNEDARQALVAALAAKEALRRGEGGSSSGVQVPSDDDGDGPPIKASASTATAETSTVASEPTSATVPQPTASALHAQDEL
ncbi:pseudouridine synthase [Dunaliella salina]|uniref:tRNA pseudouridine synthase n=1 Tax=Dunaliella salina TaxID=3046 RepID=A0ABQ7GF63_DUNSA|nr:pseudouridine synthase [Dunaliella salina]|eukprot:KAF5833245.1 pseudouridine synthase [Dunaliella salina]